ncbi:MAG: Gfo/Idh/MocA family oxidoreductase, partial [Candidatus Sumerlaeota bacterium]|nr:Gfo/Idh/MocA family oxidoreductase [Candidatus Sumerlaeota bacterium]
MSDKIRVALVGCGNRGPAHCEAVRALPDFELVGVCDIIESRARKAAERFGVDAYMDFSQLLKRRGLQAVMIATTTDAHAEQALRCAAKKKHFVVEKPLCDSTAKGKKMEAAAKKAGVVGMTGYQRTYQAANREFIRRSRDIDPLQVVMTAQRGFFLPQFFVKEMYGGIMDALTHDIDIGLRAVGGEPVGVFAQLRRGIFRPEKEAVEFVSILVD